MTRQELEAALDKGKLEYNSYGDKWYKVRRNGATKLWKTRPDEFNIPCKIGFNSFLSIDRMDMENEPSRLRIV